MASNAGLTKRRTAHSSATAHDAPRATRCRAVSGCPASNIITKMNVRNAAARSVCSRITRRTAKIKRGSQTVVAPNGHSSQKATKVENMNAAAAVREGRGQRAEGRRERSSRYMPSPAMNSDIDARKVRLFGSGGDVAGEDVRVPERELAVAVGVAHRVLPRDVVRVDVREQAVVQLADAGLVLHPRKRLRAVRQIDRRVDASGEERAAGERER